MTNDGSRPLVGVSPFNPARLYAALQADIDRLPQPTGITIPYWTPRLPLGVSAEGSALTVRNVTIAPLPTPR